MTDALAIEGMRRGARSLYTAVLDGENINARADMSACSLMSGLCLANAGLGAVHGFAGPLGGKLEACRDLEIPGLSSYGFTDDIIDEIVQASKSSSSMRGNAAPLSDEELGELLRRSA